MKVNFSALKKDVIARLITCLPPHIRYHDATHTKYVLHQAIELAYHEKINGHDLLLVKTAALYHDTGFLVTIHDHEDAGCIMARKELSQWGYSHDDILTICRMIMATKIPQNPKTHPERVLSDADLHYLGTDDFFKCAEYLYDELKYLEPELTREEWIRRQIRFLEAHHYHTGHFIETIEPVKQKNLQQLKSLL